MAYVVEKVTLNEYALIKHLKIDCPPPLIELL
jgi:hypothetical protein